MPSLFYVLTVHFPFLSFERSFLDFFLLDPLLVSSSVGDDPRVDSFDLSSPEAEEDDDGDDDDARDDGAAATEAEGADAAIGGAAMAALAPCG